MRFENFFPYEAEFCWSSSTWSEIIFPIPATVLKPETLFDIVVDVDVFKSPPGLVGQNVFMYLNGLRLASRFVSKRMLVALRIAGRYLCLQDNVLTIDTPDAAIPEEHGIKDSRRLGVQLFSIIGRPYPGAA
jgi:hypothetical protein